MGRGIIIMDMTDRWAAPPPPPRGAAPAFQCTWIDLSIIAGAVGIDQALEDGGKLVGLVEGRRFFLRLDHVEDRGNRRPTRLLVRKNRQNLEIKSSVDDRYIVGKGGMQLHCTHP